jgi:hypothetical protein
MVSNLYETLKRLERDTEEIREKEDDCIKAVHEILINFIRKGTKKYPHQIGDNQLVFFKHLDTVIFSEIPITIDACKNEFNRSGLSAAVAYNNTRDMKNMDACIRWLVDTDNYDNFMSYLVEVALPKYLKYEDIEMFKIS